MSLKDIPGTAATNHPGDKELLLAFNDTPEGQECNCPCCGRPLPFQSIEWSCDLPLLIARYAGELGITPELSGMSLIELYGVYLHLIEYDGRL